MEIKVDSIDQNEIKFTINTTVEGNFKTKELDFFLVNNNTEKRLEVNFEKEEENCSHFVVSTKELIDLDNRNWHFVYKNENDDIKPLKVSGPSAPKQASYLYPIIEISDQKSAVLYFSTKNELKVKCDLPVLIEKDAYPLFKNSIEVKNVLINKENLSLLLAEEGKLNPKLKYNLVVFNYEGEYYKVPVDYLNEKTINCNVLPGYQGVFFFYLQALNNGVLEVYEPIFYQENSNIYYEDQTKAVYWGERTTLKIKVRSREETIKKVKGNLAVKRVYEKNNELFLVFDQAYQLVKYKYYIKKRGKRDRIYLDANFEMVNDKNIVSFDLRQFNDEQILNSRWDMFAERLEINYIDVRRIGLYNQGALTAKEKYICHFPISQKQSVIPYLTKAHEISFHFATQNHYMKAKFPVHLSLKSLKMRKNNLTIRLFCSLKGKQPQLFTVDGLVLLLRSNTEIKQKIEPASIKEKTNGQSIDFEINLSELELEQFYWDFYLSINVEEEPLLVRLTCDRFLITKKLKHRMFKYTIRNDEGYLIYPYVTIKGGISLTYRLQGEYENFKNKFVEYTAFFAYHILFKFIKSDTIWLVHEKYSETAQDNSFYFFKHCYEEHKNKKIYYVIKKGSLDEKNLKPYMDRVVYFMSFKHLLLLISANLIVSSEAKGHGYAWRVSQGVIKDYLNEKKYVFLQHGVLGLKKVDNTFNYNTANTAELFIVSSDFEKKIVKEYFGYNDKNVIVTGLSRWDVLEDKSITTKKKEIFLMPTWRNWLEEVQEDKFIQSDYYRAYNSLLNSEKLKNLLYKNNLQMNFYVHPKFMPYVQNFASELENVKIIEFGEKKVNDLLMDASLLITDYSSVAWEMYYQKKPVVFFQFDLEKYDEYQGSYMNLKKDLFGDVCYDVDALLRSIEYYIETGFSEKTKFANIRGEYFKYIDRQNNKRIFKEIKLREKEILTKKTVKERLKDSDLAKSLWRRHKKNPFINNIGKRILGFLK